MIVRVACMILVVSLVWFQFFIRGSSPEIFFGSEELISCVLIPFLILLAVFDVKHLGYFLKHIAFQKQTIPTNQLVRQRDFYRFFSDVTIGVAVFTHLASMIMMLQNLEDPSSIGAAMAVSLYPLFFGVAFTQFFLNPLAKNIELSEGFTAGSLSSTPSLLLAVAVCTFSSSSFLVHLV